MWVCMYGCAHVAADKSMCFVTLFSFVFEPFMYHGGSRGGLAVSLQARKRQSRI